MKPVDIKEDVAPWERILMPPMANAAGTSLQMKLLRKGGHPFLLLPGSPRLTAAALEVYAPQSKAARGMKWVLGFASRFGLSTGLKNRTLFVRTDDPFVRFLGQVVGLNAPQFALLAGNPNTKGQPPKGLPSSPDQHHPDPVISRCARRLDRAHVVQEL